MTPEEYEEEVERELVRCYPGSTAERNVRRRGVLTGVSRQIDVLLTIPGLGEVVVEAKRWNRKVDVKGVEAFLGMMEDLEASRGLMVSTQGFSPAAIQRAWRGRGELEVDALSLAELRDFQGAGGMSHRGGHGLITPAPFGWVIDPVMEAVDGAFLAAMYQRGRSFDEAVELEEWMLIDIYPKWESDAGSLAAFDRRQFALIKETYGAVAIEVIDPPERDGGSVSCYRIQLHEQVVAMMANVEFEGFIAHFVMMTRPPFEPRDARKLAVIVEGAIELRVFG